MRAQKKKLRKEHTVDTSASKKKKGSGDASEKPKRGLENHSVAGHRESGHRETGATKSQLRMELPLETPVAQQ